MNRRKGECDIKASGYIISTAAAVILSLFLMLTYPREVRAYSETRAEIQVYCLPCTADGSQDYIISLTAADGISPAPVKGEIRTGEDSMAEFGIMLDEPGTYRYRLSQLPGDSPDMVYDSTVYDITVFAEEGEDGSIVYAVTASEAGSSGKSYRIEFHNEYTGSTELPADTSTAPATEPPVTTTVTAAVAAEEKTDSPQTTAASETSTAAVTTAAVLTTVQQVTTSAVDSAKTGDGFSPVRMAAFMAASAAAAMLLRKRRHNWI